MIKRAWTAVARRPIAANLVLVGAAYLALYLREPYVPGARPAQPLGWFGWFDQGLYLRSALAFAHGNFAAAEHHYPPLYPLLGALSVRLSPRHPFLLPDLALMLVAAGVFLAVARRRIGMGAAAAALWCSGLLMQEVWHQFIIPWTSILAAALFAGLIWELHRGAGRPGRDGPWVCARFALLAFLLLPTRPLDAVASAPLCLLFTGRWLRTARTARPPWGARGTLARIGAAAAGASVGLATYLGWNAWVYGSWLGKYGETVTTAGGFRYGELGEKLVALLLDSSVRYGDRTLSLLGHYPWLILVAIGTALALWLGDGLIRAIVLTLALQLALYAPYADLLPPGLWRYHNIHYFSWFAPYALLVPAVAGLQLWRRRTQWRVRWGAAAIAVGVLAASAIGFRAWPTEASFHAVSPTRLEVETSGGEGIDLLLVPRLGGSYTDQYFGNPAVEIGGRTLATVAEFRIVPSTDGARVLFFDRVTAPRLTIRLDPATPLPPDPAPRAYRVTYTWGWPHWLRAPALPR